jgi:7-carboxy-7-deazaguanine synthase
VSYRIKEIFYTLQGEGLNAGRPSVFCRFSGCNLWSGREQDRDKAICTFCDTDFNGVDGEGGGEYQDAAEVAEIIVGKWPNRLQIEDSLKETARPLLVFTGGEPLLQLDELLIAEVKRFGFEVAVETNGSILVPASVDWITVSPKSLDHLVQRSGNELKLVYPQRIEPSEVVGLQFDHFLISPRADLDPTVSAKNRQLALAFCMSNPTWRLSLQLHKILNIP